jgi:hypothetical protein
MMGGQTAITAPILAKVRADLKDAREHLGMTNAELDDELYLALEAIGRAVASVAYAVERLSEVVVDA